MTVKVTSRTIGPLHDPYDSTCVCITDGDVVAERYTDGLGTDWVRITKAGKLIVLREWNFFKVDKQTRHNNDLYANLVAKRHVGKRFDDAEAEYLGAPYNSGPKTRIYP